jgi:hypothetical protein
VNISPEHYQGGGFEIIIRCTGRGTSPRKHQYDFGRIVFTSQPFTDDPSGDIVRESWAVDGGWIGILGIELGRHGDGSFKKPKAPTSQIHERGSAQSGEDGSPVKLVIACPGCGRVERINQRTLTRIVAQQMKSGRHRFDVSLMAK